MTDRDSTEHEGPHSLSGPTGRVRLALVFYTAFLTIQWGGAIGFWILYRHKLPEYLVYPFTFAAKINHSDLTDYIGKMKHLTTAAKLAKGDPVYNYPAPAAYVYSWIVNTTYPVATYSILVVTAMILALCGLLYAIRGSSGPRSLAMLAGIMSFVFAYPFIFLLERSNLEGIAWTAFCAGSFLFFTQKKLAAAIAWGAGCAIKPFPVLLFVLLAKQRRWKEIAAGLGVCAILQIAALSVLGPGLTRAARDLAPGLTMYKELYVKNFRLTEARFEHSYLDSTKAILYRFHPRALSQGSDLLTTCSHFYTVFALVTFVVCVSLWWRKSGLSQFFAVVILIVTLAPVSADYTLILLYLPWGAFLVFLLRDVAQARSHLSLAQMLAVLLPCSVVFAPQNYLHSYGGILKTLALTSLLVAAYFVPMTSTLFDETAADQGERINLGRLDRQPHLQ